MPVYDKNNTKFNVIGKDIKRVDAEEKVKGTAIYAGDVSLNKMLVGGAVRIKDYPAKITKIDIEDALRIEEIIRWPDGTPNLTPALGAKFGRYNCASESDEAFLRRMGIDEVA